MFTANDIRNARFENARSGYNRDEVDAFLDTVEEDYKQYEAKVRELDARITGLTKEADDLRVSQQSIQSVLISAQKLADQIVDEAKQKAEQIIVESKVRANDINKAVDEKAAEDMAVAERNKKEAEAEYVNIMQKTAEKSEAMISAAHDSVARQQLLFDKLKLDIVNFKSQVMAIYKEHIDSLSKLPDEVPFDSVRAAEAAAFAFENVPDYSRQSAAVSDEDDAQTGETLSPDTEEKAEDANNDEIEPITEQDAPLGFKVSMDDSTLGEQPEDDDDDEQESKGFFKRKR